MGRSDCDGKEEKKEMRNDDVRDDVLDDGVGGGMETASDGDERRRQRMLLKFEMQSQQHGGVVQKVSFH